MNNDVYKSYVESNDEAVCHVLKYNFELNKLDKICDKMHEDLPKNKKTNFCHFRIA